MPDATVGPIGSYSPGDPGFLGGAIYPSECSASTGPPRVQGHPDRNPDEARLGGRLPDDSVPFNPAGGIQEPQGPKSPQKPTYQI